MDHIWVFSLSQETSPKYFTSSSMRPPNRPVDQYQGQWSLTFGRNRAKKTLQSVPLWWEGHAGSFPHFRYITHDDDILCREKHSNPYFSSLVLLLGPSTGQDAEVESTTCQGPGVKYVGTVSTSSSGQRCQNWNSTEPQRHTDTAVGEHNYCRNPHNKTVGVWCYTTNYYVRWEYCEVGINNDVCWWWLHVIRCPSVTHQLLEQ